MRFAWLCCVALIALLQAPATAKPRKWTDSTGKFTIEADLIAADDKRAVLQNTEHQLISVDLDKLSTVDRDFLKVELKQRKTNRTPTAEQTWTMKSGLKVRARAVGYGQRDMTVVERNGQIFVNDRRFDNLPEIYQKMVPKIVDHFEEAEVISDADFKSWAAAQQGKTRHFPCNGVILELDNGDRYSVPFFFFSDADLKVLQIGWERWVAATEDSEERQREDFLMEAHAQAYQQDPAANQQISQLQTGLLATIAGVTSMWQVELFVPPGVPAQPMSVIVYARDSRSASEQALQAHPQYVLGPVRRLN